MIRPDEDTLQILIRIDKKIYSWLADSMNEHIAMINDLDPDEHSNMRKDYMAKACQLKEIMDIVLNSKDILLKMQKQTEKKEETPKVNVY
jgi:hypothetical protein